LYTSPLGDLRKSIDEITSYQDQALARMTKLISKNHPYYVEKYAQLGIDVSKVDSIAKLENLPVTEKAELIWRITRFFDQANRQ
jgi:phenylacetate-coenzyme A ligase PaaK-like adenylate-forming protein